MPSVSVASLRRGLRRGAFPDHRSLTGFRLFLLLCECALRECRPSVAEVSREVSCSLRTARRLLGSMKDSGWIELAPEAGRGRAHRIAATPKLRRAIPQLMQ